jgi:aspartyl-tRNA(Asn)/glutamyl-tRNA(Gln) amidotransferase subunit A
MKAFDKAFATCDALVMPTTMGEAFKIGEKTSDPLSMYLEDMFTVIANIAGIPAISVPYSVGENKLPLGLQILTKQLGESTMYTIANFVEKNYKEGKSE